jgi:hypothetical protein
MNTRIQACSLILALAASLPAFATPPPNPTPSDPYGNTAGGSNAFHSLPVGPGGGDTGFGDSVLYNENTGSDNSAFGFTALEANTTGTENVAVGSRAMSDNTSGSANVAVGPSALFYNTTGNYNTAVGQGALMFWNGSFNTALGYQANPGSPTGTTTNNIAIGAYAGQSAGGSNNIEIGNQGASADNGAIRIGVQGTQTVTTIAGIFGGSSILGTAVYVNSAGRLGINTSSARYKNDITDMGAASSSVMSLRPVTFTYKSDETKTRQYGLVAEEVAKVMPDLVLLNDKGAPETVRYQELAPMLLNELQKEAKQLADAQSDLHEAKAELQQLREQHDKEVASIKELRSMFAAQAAVVNRLQSKVEEPVRVASR